MGADVSTEEQEATTVLPPPACTPTPKPPLSTDKLPSTPSSGLTMLCPEHWRQDTEQLPNAPETAEAEGHGFGFDTSLVAFSGVGGVFWGGRGQRREAAFFF